MITRLRRLFSITTLSALEKLKILAEKNNQKSFEHFRKTYQDFIEKNSDHIYCTPEKITPAQKERVEMVSEEVIKLNPIHFRVLIYLIQELQSKGFNYKHYTSYAKTFNNEQMWTEDCWPSIHPSNLKFQKETDQFGLIGVTGFPQKFIETVKNENIFSDNTK